VRRRVGLSLKFPGVFVKHRNADETRNHRRYPNIMIALYPYLFTCKSRNIPEQIPLILA
jgi:hypothetical protein